MRIGIVDFMQEEADRFPRLPTRTSHSNELARSVVVLVRLDGREAIKFRAGKSAATGNYQEAIQTEWAATGSSVCS